MSRRRSARIRARELVEAERLDEIVVGAGIEPGDAVGDGIARGDDQHAHLVAGAPDFLQEVEPALARQAEVEEDEAVRAVGGVEREPWQRRRP